MTAGPYFSALRQLRTLVVNLPGFFYSSPIRRRLWRQCGVERAKVASLSLLLAVRFLFFSLLLFFAPSPAEGDNERAMGGREIGGGAHADIHFYHLFTSARPERPRASKIDSIRLSMRLLFIPPQIGANE